jgi:hypothetical protein
MRMGVNKGWLFLKDLERELILEEVGGRSDGFVI